MTVILGIDIGGSGIKGAPVNIDTGEMLIEEKYRLETPQPSEPHAVAATVGEIARYFDWQGPIGCTFPAVIKSGVAHTAANVDPLWIGTNGEHLIGDATGCPVRLVNDADAAGIAEMTFGAGRGHTGLVFMLTFGTGIGSAVFINGTLIPNTELGHLELGGKIAEKRAADSVRKLKELSWEKWAERVTEYLNHLEFIFSPDLFIIGGGVSEKHDKFFHLLQVRTPLVSAELGNDAGIVGAAMVARSLVV